MLAEIAEIDENLRRHNLTALQESIQHARRKVIYETLHPETAVPGRGKNQHTPTENISAGTQTYAADAAAATNETERTIRNKTRIGNTLGDVADLLEGTAIEDNQSDLLALSSLIKSNPEMASEVSDLIQLEMTLDEARETDRLIKRHINHTRYLLLDMRDRKGWKPSGMRVSRTMGRKSLAMRKHI